MRFLLSFALIATLLISDSVASPRKLQLKRQQKEPECEIAGCIVALAELPLQITACAEALKDLDDESAQKDVIKEAAQGADCIAEATLAGIELPNDCGGCTAVLDGECPNNEVPCTGPPSK
ncbi:hypothetical protein BDZ97DRAFT_1905324 [Flammula alnicola]|nr:hypothetical protein BDZ97DRAFT_1905324 [Flammula alnicola]